MRKIIAAINMTIDGICDHTAGIPDEEIHQHYTELLSQGDAILYGRITYQLMEYWRSVIANRTGVKALDDFALAIDAIPKHVFSTTLKQVDWPSAEIAEHTLEKHVIWLKQQSGKAIFVGSPSLIVRLSNLGLIDEYQLCIHPVIEGRGMHLFKNIDHKFRLTLVKTKAFTSGAIILYYQPSPINY
jgi:dihydrofolate reductase